LRAFVSVYAANWNGHHCRHDHWYA